MSNELSVVESQAMAASVQGALRPADIVAQVRLVQEIMSSVMQEDTHYGKIPGCGDKPALFQPGAQVLALAFRLAPDFETDETAHPNGHREYKVTCNIVNINTGQKVGQGVGSCSTLESKYRYRNVADYELTGEAIPKDSKEKKNEYRRQGFGMKKVDGVWEWVHFLDTAKVENPDIADTYNTVWKMACKRAFVHGILNTTAASDMFTQDIEDLPQVEPISVRTYPDPSKEDELLKYLVAKTEQYAEFRGITNKAAGAELKDACGDPRKLDATGLQTAIDWVAEQMRPNEADEDIDF